jgi:hypothetical protein
MSFGDGKPKCQICGGFIQYLVLYFLYNVSRFCVLIGFISKYLQLSVAFKAVFILVHVQLNATFWTKSSRNFGQEVQEKFHY